MENNDILKRIKLIMNYDSKKTLTENRLLINEETSAQIIQKLRDGRAAKNVAGTNEDDIEEAIRMIQKTVKSWADFQKLDGEIEKSIIGLKLQDALNNEMGYDDLKTVEVIVNLLNQTPGVSASYKTSMDKYNEKKYYKEDSITISQKSGGQQPTTDNKKGAQGNFPSCITDVKKNYGDAVVLLTPTKEGGIQIKFKNDTDSKTYYKYIGPNYGRYYDNATKVKGYYYCDGRGIKLGLPPGTPKNTQADGAKNQQNKVGGTNWVQSPSCEDVFKGTATIKKNMKGDCVGKIQTKLIEKGYTEVGTPDNKFGKKTENAVISLQKKAGVTYNGVVDKSTYSYLFFDTTDTNPKTIQKKDIQLTNPVAEPQLTIPQSQTTNVETQATAQQSQTGTEQTQTGTQQVTSGGKRRKGRLRNLFKRNK